MSKAAKSNNSWIGVTSAGEVVAGSVGKSVGQFGCELRSINSQ
jgi:hypothetical protein